MRIGTNLFFGVITLWLLGACTAFVDIVKVDQLPPETRAAMANVAIYTDHQPRDIKYDVVASMDATSCKGLAIDPPATRANALDQLKYKALKAGANAVIGVSCTRTGVDYGANCWQTVVCAGTAVRAADSSAIAFLPAPSTTPVTATPSKLTTSIVANPGDPRSDAAISGGTNYALVIGNNDYLRLTPLKTAIHDAQAVGTLLNQRYGFQVTIVTNATRANMLRAFDEFRAKLTPADSLLIYYAGHGWLDTEAERGFWIPVDAELGNRANWLSNADISDTLKAMRARHVMVVADSCYSGTLTRDAGRGISLPVARDTRLDRIRRLRSRTALTSGGLEPVLDGGGDGHSVFARAFLTTLQENTGILDGTDVFHQVRNRVRLNAEQSPQYSNIRFTGHQVGGDFLFTARGAVSSGAGKGS